jgi:uncharacterized LabA/DUF88 family protein
MPLKRPRRVYRFWARELARVAKEPHTKRAIAFFDGQNLFHATRQAFGYRFPNYDPAKLAACVCETRRWELEQTRFYTGIPDLDRMPNWNRFWNRKLVAMSRAGVHVHWRPLRYRKATAYDGRVVLIGEEKGIDVRIAIDIMSAATANRRGIDKTDWIRVDRTSYDACLDPRDYR